MPKSSHRKAKRDPSPSSTEDDVSECTSRAPDNANEEPASEYTAASEASMCEDEDGDEQSEVPETEAEQSACEMESGSEGAESDDDDGQDGDSDEEGDCVRSSQASADLTSPGKDGERPDEMCLLHADVQRIDQSFPLRQAREGRADA